MLKFLNNYLKSNGMRKQYWIQTRWWNNTCFITSKCKYLFFKNDSAFSNVSIVFYRDYT